MNRLFGASKPVPPPQQNPVQVEPEVKPVEAPIVDLTEQSKRMENRVKELDDTIKGLEKEIAELYGKAKASRGSTQKMYQQRCLNLMKKKKLYDQQMAGFLNQQFTLDQIAFTKENIQNTIEMGAAMKQACNQQKQLFEQVNVDELEDLRDDMDDMMQETDYMNEMLNRNYGLDVDEAELDEEFANLDNEIFKEQLAKNQQQQIQNPGYPNLSASNQAQQNFN